MPIINVKVSAVKSQELNRKINELLLDITENILGKRRELIAIAIDYVEADNWWIGGVPLSEMNMHSIYFDIKVTDETNTKEEKSRYIAAAFAGFEEILGKLHEKSYIYVQDVRATAYGYEGLTQEYRYHH